MFYFMGLSELLLWAGGVYSKLLAPCSSEGKFLCFETFFFFFFFRRSNQSDDEVNVHGRFLVVFPWEVI